MVIFTNFTQITNDSPFFFGRLFIFDRFFHGFSFILCGSSARQLKKGQANLLGGRAWRYEMFPLVSAELNNLDLLKALNHGLIPSHYLNNNPRRSLRAYVQDYLKEEIFAEGLTRNIPAFSRFFESMGYSHGELTNYANIARDCGVDAKTVKEYYQILVDTLLGSWITTLTSGERKPDWKWTSFWDRAR